MGRGGRGLCRSLHHHAAGRERADCLRARAPRRLQVPEACGGSRQAPTQCDGQGRALQAHDASRLMKFLDLTQDFSLHTPAFAGYAGPAIRWVKRLAFDKAGGQEITMTLHVSTHLDAPAHFYSGGKFIGDLPLDFLIGPACVVDLERMGLGDFDLYGPEHFERWEKDTGHHIEHGDILVIHTGYHRHYPENWADRSAVDETKYFILHPAPTRAFAEWRLNRGVRG